MAPWFTTGFRAALAALTAVLFSGSLALATTSAPALGATSSAGSVSLVSQSTTVGATQSGISPFDVTLAITGSGSGPITVATQLFSAISTRSGFLSALSAAGPSQMIDQTNPLPLSCLTPSARGGSTLSIDVRASSSTVVPPFTRPCAGAPSQVPSYTLNCTIGSGDCNGVYPVQIQVQQGSMTISRFVTFLTFVERPAETPLRFAAVLRLPTSTVGVSDLRASLRASPTVAVSVAPSPVAAQQVGSTAQGQRALSELGQELASNPGRELIDMPYVPVDPGTLTASGLTHAVQRQLARGRQVLSSAGLGTARPDAGWLATSPVSQATMTALASQGVARAIIPDASLATPTAESLAWGEPFTTTPGPTSVTSLAIDPILSGQLVAGQDPVLSAQRLLADLAFLHFERPSLSMPLGVVAVSSSPVSSPRFVDTLLSGLTNNPLVVASTVSGLFDTLHPGSNGNPESRTLATTGPGSPWPSSQVNQLVAEQVRQTAFGSAVVDDPALLDGLHDQLLATESDQLSIGAREAALTAASGALDAQLASIAFGGSDITLTSLKGSVPITLTKSSAYSLKGTLVLRSTKLDFPKGSSSVVLLDHPTQSMRIPVVAVTTGDLPFTATLSTPKGDLVLARQKILVHTTQTSAVAIILTVGAALVLIAWWIRTSAKKPRSRHRASS